MTSHCGRWVCHFAFYVPSVSILADSFVRLCACTERLKEKRWYGKAVTKIPKSADNDAGAEATVTEKGTEAEEEEEEVISMPALTLLLQQLMASVCYRLHHPVLSFMDFKVTFSSSSSSWSGCDIEQHLCQCVLRFVQAGDIVLFMPALVQGGRKIWMAFNSGSPYHFLAEVHSHTLHCLYYLWIVCPAHHYILHFMHNRPHCL